MKKNINKTLFGKSLSLLASGYLIIKHTEVLHLIDVNSGKKCNAETKHEQTAINVNSEKASEIPHQPISTIWLNSFRVIEALDEII
ncbi:MAG: hypothetical protein EAZ07_05150 [Cytophagales bacterium]|nr:MAG: hypothetical protein EAZ07_05150 [Cytophagales bacterium]